MAPWGPLNSTSPSWASPASNGAVPQERTDEEILEVLYQEHGGALFVYALRLSGDRELAEEVVQDALLRAWTHPEAVDGQHGTPQAWLFTVIRNLVTDAFRRRQARPVTTVAVDGPDSAQGLERALESWVVAEAAGRLSPDHRAVLGQVFYLGRSVREAANELGIPPGTVKSRTYFALQALRLALAETGYQQ